MNFGWNWSELSTVERVIAVLFGLFLLNVIFQSTGFFTFMVLLFFLWWVFSDDDEDEDEEEVVATVREKRPASTESVYPHALAAVREAGLKPEHLGVLPVDIGLIAFYGDERPRLHHTRPVADDSDYLQPFVQLRVPQVAIGRIKFEILDHYGQQVFVHEDTYQLERGRNLVTPTARLPLHDEQNTEGVWELRIFADGRLLAKHVFGWDYAQSPDFERHVGEDGEINSELRAVLAQSKLEKLSLDELLAHQDDDDERAARR